MKLFKSRRKSVDKKDIITTEEFEKELNSWKRPKIPMYKTGLFSLKADYTIKTIEQIVSLFNENKTTRLLPQSSTEELIEKYKYLHFGSVQAAAKPISRQGLINSTLHLYVLKRLYVYRVQ